MDVLHFRGRSERSAGGAGLYTALAAQRAGADVLMVAPYPDPMPPELVAAAARLDWRGPAVGPEGLPRFEIEHRPGGGTTYHAAEWGAEGELTVDDVPGDLPPGLMYIVPMIDTRKQVEFARHFGAAGWTVACGTYGGATRKNRDLVLESLDLADRFFCNEPEALALFGDLDDAGVPAGKLLFVTRGELGARVVQGDHHTDVAPVRVEELDPTGAGDTFCGTALAILLRGEHPVVAARHAAAAAAEMVTGVGPEKLMSAGAARPPAADPRVVVDPDRIAALAGVVRNAPEATPFDFTGRDFPDIDDPRALDFFFAATLQQFGFWTAAPGPSGRYLAPMVAALHGRRLKGSDFLWAAYRRWLDEAPHELTPTGQAAVTRPDYDRRLRDDSGANPLPAGHLHPEAANSYGRDMTALGEIPGTLLERARASERPLGALLELLDRVGGYKEDPLRKKSALLALILMQRPERFLEPGEGEDAPPIVDYHSQRSCLRLGLVRVADPDLERRLTSREIVSRADEEAVRRACHEAVAEVRRLSGRPMGAVDWFFFQNRTRCPEMTEPDCAACPADPVCAHRRELFQPVRRTTAY